MHYPPLPMTVAIISAGAVGVALAERVIHAGYTCLGVHAPSLRSQRRVEQRIPTLAQLTVPEALEADCVILAVPDSVLGDLAHLCATDYADHLRAGQIFAHTSGSQGCQVLQELTDQGAVPLALHPAMTFVDTPQDSRNLHGAAWGITADSEEYYTVAELFIMSLGGIGVRVPEDKRPLYHAAMAHGANHLNTLISDSLAMLDHVFDEEEEGDADCDEREHRVENPNSSILLRALAEAALHGALERRREALTGPIARGDEETVKKHSSALKPYPVLQERYNRLAAYTAQSLRDEAG